MNKVLEKYYAEKAELSNKRRLARKEFHRGYRDAAKGIEHVDQSDDYNDGYAMCYQVQQMRTGMSKDA